MIPAIAFMGRSGSGKTTFLERLIPVLVERGLRVGVLKHAHHKIEIDTPGKDSFRLRQAGAIEVVANAPNQMALIRTPERELPLREVLGYFRDVDLVLIEGYKGERLPFIEIHRSGTGPTEPLFPRMGNPLALITDRTFPAQPFPVFALDDIRRVADLIEEKIL